MKNINTKSAMVITIIVASFIIAPVMVSANENGEQLDFSQIGGISGEGIIDGFENLLGGMFRGMGYAGNLLGAVFSMLFMQTLDNFSETEILDNVYALSASTVETVEGNSTFADLSVEINTLPFDYNQSYLEINNYGNAYCVVNTSGYIDYEIEYGAAVTLVIWDNDGSLITAVKKLVSFFKTLRPLIEGDEVIPETLITEGVELVTWFLIHINDIFTGEELFALNPITWQNINVTAGADFSVEKTWKVTGPDWKLNPNLDDDLNDTVGSVQYDLLMDLWNFTAQTNKNGYIEWLLTSADDLSSYTATWTSFTFDLIQLWVREFHIEIDVGEIVNSLSNPESLNVASVFQGLDIDFYLFTHHLAGAYLYNDRDGNNKITTSYDNLKNSTGDIIYHEDGITPVQGVNSSEVTHKLLLKEVGDFEFTKPYKSGTNKFSWGLTLHDPKITPVPVGVNPESYLSSSPDSLEYISFGFTFEPEINGNVLKAPIKLDQFFAPFNGNGVSNNNIAGLDLAILYVSTILHFSLEIDVLGEDTEDPSTWLNEEDDYYEETHSLRVGNYLGKSFSGKLEFVDIAGPDYSYGLNEGDDYAPANSSILPIALYESETKAHKTFTPSGSDSYQTFSADIGLNISFNVVFYAVCFPEFNGGNGIWHDPTFSVFMVFEATGFWALILLVAGVGLLGVATILIKRRKDSRF